MLHSSKGVKEGGSDAVPAHCSAPSLLKALVSSLRPQETSPGLSLPLLASVTCLGPTRTFQNWQRGGAPIWPLEHPAFLGKARPCLSPPQLYRRGNRGRGFEKHTFPVPVWKHSLTLLILCPLWGLVGPPGPLREGGGSLVPIEEGRGSTGRRGLRALGGEARGCCHLPSHCPLPGAPAPAPKPQRAPSHPGSHHVNGRRARKQEPI